MVKSELLQLNGRAGLVLRPLDAQTLFVLDEDGELWQGRGNFGARPMPFTHIRTAVG
jgi:hypothetical protein